MGGAALVLDERLRVQLGTAPLGAEHEARREAAPDGCREESNGVWRGIAPERRRLVDANVGVLSPIEPHTELEAVDLLDRDREPMRATGHVVIPNSR